MKTTAQEELGGEELQRRQSARNLMDCYALGMDALSGAWGRGAQGHKALESLTRLMLDGMTTPRKKEEERAFYLLAAGLCRECALACEGTAEEKATLFRIYGKIFKDLSGGRGI